jgi:hypothetical protein
MSHKMTDYTHHQSKPQGGILAWLRACYSPFPSVPSIPELVAQELDTARRELLAAQTRLDHATAQVAYQQARIARLAKVAR